MGERLFHIKNYLHGPGLDSAGKQLFCVVAEEIFHFGHSNNFSGKCPLTGQEPIQQVYRPSNGLGPKYGGIQEREDIGDGRKNNN